MPLRFCRCDGADVRYSVIRKRVCQFISVFNLRRKSRETCVIENYFFKYWIARHILAQRTGCQYVYIHRSFWRVWAKVDEYGISIKLCEIQPRAENYGQNFFCTHRVVFSVSLYFSLTNIA